MTNDPQTVQPDTTLVALVNLAGRIYELRATERRDIYQFVGALGEQAPCAAVWRALRLLVAHVECDIAEDRQIGDAVSEFERMLREGGA